MLGTLIKLLFSIVLIGLFLFKVDFGLIKETILSPECLYASCLAVAIILLQNLIVGFRLIYLTRLFQMNLNWQSALKISFIGSFFAQVMISFVGGDAMRIWSLRQYIHNTHAALHIVLLDRIVGFIALIFLLFLSLMPLLQIISDEKMRLGVIFLVAWCGIGALSFFLLGGLPSRFKKIKWIGWALDLFSNSRYLLNSKRNSSYSFLASIGIHFTNILAMFVFFQILR